MNESVKKAIDIIKNSSQKKILRKIVFSKSKDKTVLKAVISEFAKNGVEMFQLEYFLSDNKAKQKNFSFDLLDENLCELFMNFRQTDIITTGGSCTVMISKNGEAHIKNNIDLSAEKIEAREHDNEKKYILSSPSAVPFLKALGICSDSGVVLDKKRAKFRQINRFLEIVEDIYPSLNVKDTLTVCDICCGKAYLTFAVYWYLTEIKGRNVEMYGVDLKGDVIEYCDSVAKKLGYNIHFLCENALDFVSPRKPDMVISLHACDIATDIVLANAIKNYADVILSTPCCHHEMFNQINSPVFSFITDYSILKQKLCDAATDSLRSLRLEMENYSVNAIELIDPDETPKNVLIRAVKRKNPLSESKKEQLNKKYNDAISLLGVNPKLNELLK